MSFSIPGGDRFVNDKVRTLMESAVTAWECLEKETLSEAKMKRELTSTKNYKALAWEQLDKTADETRLLCSYAGKKKDTVDFLESTLIAKGRCVGDSRESYARRESWLTFLSPILMNEMKRHLNKRMRLIGTLLKAS